MDLHKVWGQTMAGGQDADLDFRLKGKGRKGTNVGQTREVIVDS